MNKFLVSCLFLTFFYSSVSQAQSPAKTWETLAKVVIKTKYNSKEGYEIDYPVFSEEVKALNGKIISIKGYIIPLDDLKGQNYFILSALPYNLCYFCGGAGPETVMEVYTLKEIPYSSKPITLKGRLKINANDYNHLMYLLKEATLVK